MIKLGFNFIYQFFNGAGGQGAFLTGLANSTEQFLPIELLTPLVLLDYEETGRL
jgi:hypothetical protein